MDNRMKSIGKKLWDNLITVLFIYFFGEILFFITVYWDHPEYGFSQFGLGVLAPLVFPLLWILIYYFCKIIAALKADNAALQLKLNAEGKQ